MLWTETMPKLALYHYLWLLYYKNSFEGKNEKGKRKGGKCQEKGSKGKEKEKMGSKRVK